MPKVEEPKNNEENPEKAGTDSDDVEMK